jgi:hypothetical protein
MFPFSGLATLSPSSSLQDSLSPKPFSRPLMFTGHTAPAFGSSSAFAMAMPSPASPAPQQQFHSHMQFHQLPQQHHSSGVFSIPQQAAPFGFSNLSTPQVAQSPFWNAASFTQAVASSSSSTFAMVMPFQPFPAPMQSPFVSQPQLQFHWRPLMFTGQTAPAFGSSSAFAMAMPSPASPAPQQQFHSHMQFHQLPQQHHSSGVFSIPQQAAPFGFSNLSTPQVAQSPFWNAASFTQAVASSSSSPFAVQSSLDSCSGLFSDISSRKQNQADVSSSCSFHSVSLSQTAQVFDNPFSPPPHVHSSAADSCSASSSVFSFRFDDEDGISDKGTSHDDQHEMIDGISDKGTSHDDQHEMIVNEGDDGGLAPGVDDRRSTSTDGQHSRASTISTKEDRGLSSDPRLPTKQMKAASKSLQFFTTIVVKSCCWVKEHLGFVGTTKRSSTIFEKVECGLRDRVNYPLPPEVALKDLMAFSAFQGPDAESLYDAFCVSKTQPLKSNMIGAGEKWYNNKFTDIRKIISNRILPKFLNIVKSITNDGTKSG